MPICQLPPCPCPFNGLTRTMLSLRMSDATTYAGWLQHLGTFAGTFYRKYHSLADLQPLLHYLLHKIRSSETSDLVIVQVPMLSFCVDFMGWAVSLSTPTVVAGPSGVGSARGASGFHATDDESLKPIRNPEV